MKGRCFCPKDKDFENYGKRGITVCDRWKDSFAAFYEDIGNIHDGLTIDRIDVNGNYEPGNVRLATISQQARNKRRSRYLTYDGRTLLLQDWAKVKGMATGTLSSRMYRGWSIHDALEKPIQKKKALNCLHNPQ